MGRKWREARGLPSNRIAGPRGMVFELSAHARARWDQRFPGWGSIHEAVRFGRVVAQAGDALLVGYRPALCLFPCRRTQTGAWVVLTAMGGAGWNPRRYRFDNRHTAPRRKVS